eukprot:5654036-Amphidinium_carterae.1
MPSAVAFSATWSSSLVNCSIAKLCAFNDCARNSLAGSMDKSRTTTRIGVSSTAPRQLTPTDVTAQGKQHLPSRPS